MLSISDPAYHSWNRHLVRRFPDAEFLQAFYPMPLQSGRFRKLSVVFRSLEAVLLATGLKVGARRSVLAHMADVDAVIVVGGSDLFEIKKPFTSTFRLRRITEAAKDAAKIGVPVYLWGHTLGPFETKSGRRIASNLFEAAEQILVRDSASLQIALSLVPHAKATLAPDFAFAIRPSTESTDIFRKKYGKYVAIVPRRNFFDEDGSRTNRLLDQFSEFSRGLLARGDVDSVLLVPQVTGPSALEDDRDVVSKLASKIDDERAKVVDVEDYGPSEFCELYSNAVGVIAVRLHGAILAMTGGTPALAVAYFTAKTSGVMEGLGLSDSWTEFDECTASYLQDWWGVISADDRRSLLVEEVTSRARIELAQSIGGTF
jgi:polysaccharide pyruvyl transferase WcaK-like protein